MLVESWTVLAAPFLTFDDIPVTDPDAVPQSSAAWDYKPEVALDKNGGWKQVNGYPDNPSVRNLFYTYSPTENSTHMGFESYSYFEIVGAPHALVGNCLRHVITGGKNQTTCPDPNDATSCLGNGLPLYNKDTYLAYLANGQNPAEGGMVVGNAYSYFTNTSPRDTPVPFPESQGMNVFSLYAKFPFSLDNDDGDVGHPSATLTVGPYSHIPSSIVYDDPLLEGEVTGHWYNHCYVRGPGWVHVTMSGKSEHNNSFHSAELWPYPQRSMRDLRETFFNNCYRFYLACHPYVGIATPPYEFLFDEMEFLSDPEQRNTETISTLCVLLNDRLGSFEISFNDKYLTTTPAIYEVRSSFFPITNANWNQATPVHVLPEPSLNVSESTAGVVQKNAGGYRGVWAPFKLATQQDRDALVPGTTIYFAVKDISNRPYDTQPEQFDVSGDQAVLHLINRIDYFIAEDAVGKGSVQVTVEPAQARDSGALWRRIGASVWRKSGDMEQNVPVGPCTVEFRDIPDWETPSNQEVTLSNGVTEAIVGTYGQSSSVEGWVLY
jgi:hypothetical protein